MSIDKKGVFHELIYPTLILIIISTVVVCMMVWVNSFTRPKIEANQQRASMQAIYDLFPDGHEFKSLDKKFEPTKGVNIKNIYQSTDETKTAIVLSTNGYGGEFDILVGINEDGTIYGVRLLDNNETPGFGQKTGDPEFTDQFKDKAIGEVDADIISGATITSKAFINAVNVAMEIYDSLK